MADVTYCATIQRSPVSAHVPAWVTLQQAVVPAHQSLRTSYTCIETDIGV